MKKEKSVAVVSEAIKSREITMVDIDLLVENPKNNNTHSEEQIEKLAKLIGHTGFRSPIIVSKRSGFVVCGHGRLSASKLAGLKFLPVIYQEFRDEAEEYSFMTSENAIHSWSSLDLKKINLDILDFGEDFDIDMLGIKEFTLGLDDKDEMEDEIREDLNKKFVLEITFPNGEELADIRDDLTSRGYIVKEK